MNIKSTSYLMIMLVGSAIYNWFTTGVVSIAAAIGIIIFACLFALLSNGVNTLWRKFISKKVLKKEPSHEFLFELIEDTFASWLLIGTIVIIGLFLKK